MERNHEIVTFRDGTELTVEEANWGISAKLQALEKQAIAEPLEDKDDQEFYRFIYVRLAACSSGKVPTVREALDMPNIEIDKWFAAANRMNPVWFVVPEDTTVEKKEMTPTESTPS